MSRRPDTSEVGNLLEKASGRILSAMLKEHLARAILKLQHPEDSPALDQALEHAVEDVEEAAAHLRAARIVWKAEVRKLRAQKKNR